MAIEPIYRNVGCRECRNVGYTGRMGDLRIAGHQRQDSTIGTGSGQQLGDPQEAANDGMRTLRMDAWDKVIAGDTTVDEVLRVTKGEAL